MITVITPTHDRPEVWPLTERWMARQTLQPDQWIVVDDGEHPAPLTQGQQHLRTRPSRGGAKSLAMNLLAAISKVEGDTVLVMEDDDYYSPSHIEVCANQLAERRASITGCLTMRYYNVRFRSWLELPNVGSALCNTAFMRQSLPMLQRAAEIALARGVYHVDRFFWQSVHNQWIHRIETVVGIKGMPGTVGLGMGHRPSVRWIRDPKGDKLEGWIGSDVAAYRPFMVTE